MNDLVTNGVFRITGPYDAVGEDALHRLRWVRSAFKWLREYYRSQGRDEAAIKRDALAFAHWYGMLPGASFDEIMFGYHWYTESLDTFKRAGVANDLDPSGPHPDEWSFFICRSRSITEASLPKIITRPFAPMSRPRAWTHQDLCQALKIVSHRVV